MKHRVGGAAMLAMALGLSFLLASDRVFPAKAVLALPCVGAVGLWLLAFGHPVREDGLAPVWWRAGLGATLVVLFAASLFYVTR